MKTYLKAFILILIPSLTVLVNPPSSVEASMVQKEMTNHLGKKVVVNGTTKATAYWTPVDSASSYHVYFKICGSSNYEGSVRVGDKGSKIEIGYLNAAKRYCYQAVPLISGKERWEKAPEKKLYSPQPVLGATTINSNSQTYTNPDYDRSLAMNKPEIAYEKPRRGQVGIDPIVDPTNDVPPGVPPQTSAVARWNNDYKSQTNKIHVYYWTNQSDKHAVRNLPGNANEVMINYLNPTARYSYSVQAVLHNGKTVMLLSDGVLKKAAVRTQSTVQGATNVYQPYQYTRPNVPQNYQY